MPKTGVAFPKTGGVLFLLCRKCFLDRHITLRKDFPTLSLNCERLDILPFLFHLLSSGRAERG